MSTEIEIADADTGFPSIDAEPQSVDGGPSFFTEPGVAVIARPNVARYKMEKYLLGFDEELCFEDYLDDPHRSELTDGAQLTMMAGQLCYQSFGLTRSKCYRAKGYIENLKSQSHGSVMEHTNYSLLIYGISRSVSHELVRHRAGTAFSQVSQRYVDGKTLRFVERPEFQHDPQLHRCFLDLISTAAEAYDKAADYMAEMRAKDLAFAEMVPTERRKAVNQAARSILPNCTETAMVLTGNIRAWRNILEQRCSLHAEPEIRILAYRIYRLLVTVEPELFSDYHVHIHPSGGPGVIHSLSTVYKKV